MTCTVHHLLHLAKCTERYGPLWTTWAFMFESWNGFITSFVHSKQNIEVQLLDAFGFNQALLMVEDALPPKCISFDHQNAFVLLVVLTPKK